MDDRVKFMEWVEDLLLNEMEGCLTIDDILYSFEDDIVCSAGADVEDRYGNRFEVTIVRGPNDAEPIIDDGIDQYPADREGLLEYLWSKTSAKLAALESKMVAMEVNNGRKEIH